MLPLALVLLLGLLVEPISARCLNWCNKRGICTSPASGEQHCVCEAGYSGEDCSQQICPKSFDPIGLEKLTNRRSILISTSVASGFFEGYLEFTFGLSTISFDADARTMTNESCTAAFARMASVSSVSCGIRRVDQNSGAGAYEVTFNSFPVTPYENNIFSHNGNPILNAFFCNTSKVEPEEAIQPLCVVDDLVSSDIPVYAQCSNHGTCDTMTGICECHKGYKGLSCNDMRDHEDKHVYYHDGPFFTANLLALKADIPSSSNFNMLIIQNNGKNITKVTGDAQLVHSGGALVGGSLTIGATSGELEQFLVDSHREVPSAFSVFHQGRELTSVDRNGRVVTSGGFAAGNGSFVVDQSMTTMSLARIVGSLEVGASAHVEESLFIGSGFALTPTGMTVDVASHFGTLFELKSRQPEFTGSLFEIHTVGNSSTLIRGVVDGITTVELTSAGELTTQHLRMLTGGIDVGAGGVRIGAGGLTVKGGLSILSGGLSLSSQDLAVGSISASDINAENNNESSYPLFVGTVHNPHFGGTVIDISLPESASFASLLTAKTTSSTSTSSTSTKTIFNLDNKGTITSTGGASFGGDSGLKVSALSALEGGIALSQKTVIAGPLIELPIHSSFITITDDGKKSKNELVFPSHSHEGHVLVISNMDEHQTHGPVEIAGKSSIMLLFDGNRWIDVQALKAPTRELRNVELFEAANDLDIGNVTLSAGRLRATRLTKGSLVLVGHGGSLTEAASGSLSFASGILSAPILKINKLAAAIPIDAQGAIISNAELANIRITSGVAHVSELLISGENGIAFFDFEGRLKSMHTLRTDSKGHLSIPSLYGDLNMNGHNIDNVTIHKGTLSNIKQASISRLFIDSVATNAVKRHQPLAYFSSSTGELLSTEEYLTYDDSSHSFHAKYLGSFTLQEKADFNNQIVENANLQGGKLTKMSSIDTEALSINSFKNAVGKDYRLLAVNKDGDVVVADKLTNKDRDAGITVSTDSASIGELTVTKNLKLDGATLSGVKFDANSMDFGTIEKFSVGSLSIQSLASTTGTSSSRAVAVDATGKLVTSNNFNVDTLTATTAVKIPSGAHIELVDLHNTLLAVDSAGKIVSAGSKGTTYAFDKIKVNNAELDDITTSGSGSFESVSIRALGHKDTKNGMVVVADSAGKMQTTSSVTINSLTTETFYANGVTSLQGGLQLPSLPIHKSQSKTPLNLLVIGAESAVETASDIVVDSLHIVKNVDIGGVVTVSSLSSESSSNGHSAAMKDYIHAHPQFQSLVGTTSTGNLELAHDVVVGNMASVGNIESTGIISARSFQFLGKDTTSNNIESRTNAVLVTGSDGTGSVHLSKSVMGLDSLKSVAVDVTGVLTTDQLILPSILSSNLKKELSIANVDHEESFNHALLSVDTNGKVHSVSASTMVQQIVSNLPPIARSNFDSLVIKDSLSVNEMTFSSLHGSTDQQTVLTVDKNGKVASLDVNKIKLTKFSVEELVSSGSISSPAITISSLSKQSRNSDDSSPVLSVDSAGIVTAANGLSHTNGVLTAKGVKVSSLSGKIDAIDATISKATITHAKIEDSDIVLPEGVAFGSVVVRTSTGSISSSAAVSVDATGALVVGTIKPPSTASAQANHVLIHSASLVDASIQGGILTQTQSIDTASITVSGDSDLRGNVNIASNLHVLGSVVGSRPYMDNSDSRFKTHITPIKNALQKVLALDGVTFKYNTKAFPSRNFANTTQIGWVADQVMNVVPELVESDEQGYKSVAYARAVSLVGQAVKELNFESQQKIDQLTMELNQLKETVNQILAKLN